MASNIFECEFQIYRESIDDRGCRVFEKLNYIADDIVVLLGAGGRYNCFSPSLAI